MTVASVQARMDALELRFSAPTETDAASSLAASSASEFSELMERFGAATQLSGGARLGGRNPGAFVGQDSGSPVGLGLTGTYSTSSTASYIDSLTSGQGLSGMTSSASGSASGGAGSAVVVQGLKHLGTPYLWGGTDPAVGLDCSALVQHAYRDVGVELPRVSRDQARMGVEVNSLDDAQAGDLVAFGSPVDHISIYVGNGKILHAPRSGDVVRIADISRPITTIRRVIAAGSETIAGMSPGMGVGSSAERSYQNLFEQAGRAHGVDPALLAAVAAVESGFNPSAQSPVGAQGLMQFMPATAAEMGVDPMNPASAIDGAARYLKREIDRFGSIELAAAAYNAGAGAVTRHGGIPPYAETQNYVKKVLSAYEVRR